MQRPFPVRRTFRVSVGYVIVREHGALCSGARWLRGLGTGPPGTGSGYRLAMTSISTETPLGSLEISTQERAGGFSGKYSP